MPLVSSGAWDDFQEGVSFLCEESSYSFPFKDFVDLGWTNVEKVWLDGNFLTGEIPEYIARAWPSLQSLDLYDNRLEGQIPESLGQLDLVKLQLQANNFSGVLPDSVANLLRTRSIVLGLSANPELKGCIPVGGGIGVGHTRITDCGDALEL